MKEERKYHLSVSLSVRLTDSVCWCVCLSSVCLSICLSVYLSVSLSACLSVCLSPCLPVCLPVHSSHLIPLPPSLPPSLTISDCRALKGSRLRVVVGGRGKRLSAISLRMRIRLKHSWSCCRPAYWVGRGLPADSGEGEGGREEGREGDEFLGKKRSCL